MNTTSHLGLESPISIDDPCVNAAAEPTAIDSFLTWALYWFHFGFAVIPVLPRSKQTAVKWDPWLSALTIEAVQVHWTAHPDHEVGFIVGSIFIVLDADTQAATDALIKLEAKFGATPCLTVNTTKGQHHYFRRKAKTQAQSDGHSSVDFPARIDVKTGRALVVLPGSFGKTIAFKQASDASELTAVGQDFIDAVFQHNGRPAPSEKRLSQGIDLPITDADHKLPEIKRLLELISPDLGYQDWLNVLMAVYHETSGGNDGLRLAINWSCPGITSKGPHEVEAKWRGFRADVARPLTMGTLVHMARQSSGDVQNLGKDYLPPCSYEVVEPDEVAPPKPQPSENPFLMFSLQGMAEEVAENATAQTPILGGLAVMGQVTVWYASPGTGKTLLTMSLLIQDLRSKLIDPGKVIYLNCDDNSHGLAEKLRLADEYGFHMLAPGYKGFKPSEFRKLLTKLTATESAKGTFIVLDTLKKFVSLMEKTASSEFLQVIRNFVLRGGTVLALAHTNKKLGADDKPVFAGTSDVLDDVDAGYTIAMHSKEGGHKVVVFDKLKGRGHNLHDAAYRYSLETDATYTDLVLSVEAVDAAALPPVQHQADTLSDAKLIEAVIRCIGDGICTKMELARAVMERAKVSRQTATKVIEKYTGDDPALHQWSFKVKARGAKVFAVLAQPGTPPADPPIVLPDTPAF